MPCCFPWDNAAAQQWQQAYRHVYRPRCHPYQEKNFYFRFGELYPKNDLSDVKYFTVSRIPQNGPSKLRKIGKWNILGATRHGTPRLICRQPPTREVDLAGF